MTDCENCTDYQNIIANLDEEIEDLKRENKELQNKIDNAKYELR